MAPTGRTGNAALASRTRALFNQRRSSTSQQTPANPARANRPRRAPAVRPQNPNDIFNFLPAERPVATRPESNVKSEIIRRFGDEIPLDVGDMNDECSSCGALHFLGERTQNDMGLLNASYSTCCRKGQVVLPVRYDEIDYPSFLAELLVGQDDGEMVNLPILTHKSHGP
ncbi:hypothetical protein PtB15_7B785 [Puccinia triticina]|nr:hypothetical protein PtB15_7B785 [Puccinia triticina]